MSFVVGSEEWLVERRSYLGASEMPAALGLSPWGDPIGVWEEKLGIAPPRPESFRMKLGTLIEPIIGKLTSEQLGARLVHPSGPIRLPNAPFLASNPDFRIVGRVHKFRLGRGLVQAKLRLDEPFGEVDDGEGLGIPLHYRIQGWGELLTTDADYVYFAALNPREGVSLYPLDRRMGENEQAISDLYDDCVEYWQSYVVPKKAPPPSAKSAEALRRRYPDNPATRIGKIASAEQEQVLDEFLRMKESAKAIDETVDELKNRVKSWIGDAAYLEGAGKRFTWSRFDVTKVAWEEVAKALRKLIENARQGDVAAQREIADRDALDLDMIEGLYTRVEPSDRLTIGGLK